MQRLRSEAIGGLEAKTALSLFIQAAFEKQYSFALWKLPNDDVKHFILDTSGNDKTIKPDIHNLAPGFLVGPFINEGDNTTYIKADVHYQFLKETFSPHPNSVVQSPDAIEKLEKVAADLLANPKDAHPLYQSSATITDTEEQDFIALTHKAIQQIKQGNLEKLVPAKCKLVALPEKFDLVDCFYNLCEAYPHAMVSLVATPSLGTWMGATPEVLVSMDKHEIFKTMSLAGTQKLPGNNIEDAAAQASWTAKEIEEQALVSRYIINCFKRIRLREYTEKGPTTVVAGNLMHLKTDFWVDTKTVSFPELPTVMLELLHPTSAVCGMPREASIEFLREHEGFDRQLYSGYLGPVNIEDETHLYVNLRCMQLLASKAAVYAGAGVTVNSNPAKEWQETELKCETLLNVVFGI